MATGFTALLIANRGEIAIRIARAAAECGLRTVTVHAEDDAASLHTRKSDETRALEGTGPSAYLDVEQIVAAARAARCDAIHPGYGFLSENASFARRCAAEGLAFVGPSPEVIERFGDKARARALAERLGVPTLSGTTGPTSLDEARAFLATEGSIMIKAIAGGGGRGMRPVHHADEVEAAYARCRSEALQSFGCGDVYVERLLPRARHVEVQLAGDRPGAVTHLWERECSLQRHRQKLVEVAPARWLAPGLRERLLQAAVTLGRAAGLDNLATVEFLVGADGGEDAALAFIEVNPRLQVEHTITEEITGLDLVRLQLELATGRTLHELGIDLGRVPAPRGIAIEARINMETMAPDGSARPAGGTLTAFEPPSGPGIRVDTFGYQGYRTSQRYDSLLAKLVVSARSGEMADVAAKAYRALCEFKIAGVPTNAAFLQSLLRHPAVVGNRVHTGFVEEHAAELLAPDEPHRRLFFEAVAGASHVGARVNPDDPLAVLAHGKSAPSATPRLSEGARRASPPPAASARPRIPPTGRASRRWRPPRAPCRSWPPSPAPS